MRVIVVGGGAAGMLAAIAAKKKDPRCEVMLFEKNDKLGRKLFITGKGRGNLTNAASPEDFLENYVTNKRFLYSAFSAFDNRRIIQLLEKYGCRTETERGGRVFPVSGHAYSITDALKLCMKKEGVIIRYKTPVRELIIRDGRITGIEAGGSRLSADRVIIATGGLSYPSTGSTGDGYRFARDAGMTVTETYPALVHFDIEEPDVRRLRGLTLKNIAVRITDDDNKKYYEDFGDLDFLETGIRGPVILSASSVLTSVINAKDPKKRKLLTVHIDLKPAVDSETLERRLQKELEEGGTKPFRSVLQSLMPGQLLYVFTDRLKAAGADPEKRAGEVGKQDRKAAVRLLKDMCFTIRGTGSFKEAIITQGGISVRELDPKTMESKKVRGLYFAGEVIDVDGYTGGFNMQMAFSTGYLAGSAAVLKEDENHAV